MKDIVKSIYFFGISLIVSIIIYPFLHELGHIIMAFIFGVKVIEINLFPTPNIIYKNFNINNIENLLIGFGGMFLPLVLSLNIRSKRFWIWYTNFILKSICLLSMCVSALSIIFKNNNIFNQDDMHTLLSLWSKSKLTCLIIIFFTIIILILNIYNEDLKKIHEF